MTSLQCPDNRILLFETRFNVSIHYQNGNSAACFLIINRLFASQKWAFMQQSRLNLLRVSMGKAYKFESVKLVEDFHFVEDFPRSHWPSFVWLLDSTFWAKIYLWVWSRQDWRRQNTLSTRSEWWKHCTTPCSLKNISTPQKPKDWA